MKLAHRQRIASTTIKLISKKLLLSILSILVKTFQRIVADPKRKLSPPFDSADSVSSLGHPAPGSGNMQLLLTVLCDYRRERIEPMKGTEFPQRPWSRVGVDFFVHKGHTYLLAIDYYSRDVEICLVTKKVDTSETTVKLKKVFSRHGIADRHTVIR